MRKVPNVDILRTVAEYRLLTIPQITALLFSSKQVARRRIRQLCQAGVLTVNPRGLGRSRGRPENLISVGEDGAERLRQAKLLPEKLPFDRIGGDAIRCTDHQILINWFRVHLLQIPVANPAFSIDFLSPTSPFMAGDGGTAILYDRVTLREGEEPVGFTPDAVFSITHKGMGKSLLFFLEADTGAEALASPKRDPRDIRQKIEKYRCYLGRRLYKRYEKIFNASFNGFRLLILTSDSGRKDALCRLVREMQPSDFVWVTEQEQMFSSGLGDAMWARGGQVETESESILGQRFKLTAPTTVAVG